MFTTAADVDSGSAHVQDVHPPAVTLVQLIWMWHLSQWWHMHAVTPYALQVGASHFLDIPRIVVVGDQSAGKSSIIQRICGVDLPRSEGTCTRCPMEVSAELHATCRMLWRFELSGTSLPYGGQWPPDAVDAPCR
jgi:hypothetical protein